MTCMMGGSQDVKPEMSSCIGNELYQLGNLQTPISPRILHLWTPFKACHALVETHYMPVPVPETLDQAEPELRNHASLKAV